MLTRTRPRVLTTMAAAVLLLLPLLVVPAGSTGADADPVVAGRQFSEPGYAIGHGLVDDAAEDFRPGEPADQESWRDPTAAEGEPDCVAAQGSPPATQCFVSLGVGGSLLLRLSHAAGADGLPTPDFVLHECCPGWELQGPDEPMRIRLLGQDGQAGPDVTRARTAGGTVSIDLDGLGYGIDDLFPWVLIEDAREGESPDTFAGPDIDAVWSHAARHARSFAELLGRWQAPGLPELRIENDFLEYRANPVPGYTCDAPTALLTGTLENSYLGSAVYGHDCGGNVVEGYALLYEPLEMRMCVRRTSAPDTQPYECTSYAPRGFAARIGGDDPLLTIILFLLWWFEFLGEPLEPADPPAFALDVEPPLVYAATDGAFPDALAVAGITGLTRGYTVLVDPDDPTGNAELLDALGPREVVIIGGTAAIPDTAIPDDGTPRRRLGGASRFDTAALISREHFPPAVDTVYIATGNNYPDALAGGAAASLVQAPILLVDQATIPQATAAELDRLSPARIVVLGGSAVIPDSVVAQLQGYTTGPVTRLAGADRTETAVEISRSHFPSGAEVVMVANAEDFRNAEGAAGAAWSTQGPLLLVRPNGPLPDHVRAEIARLDPDRIVIVSSAGELSEETLEELETLS